MAESWADAATGLAVGVGARCVLTRQDGGNFCSSEAEDEANEAEEVRTESRDSTGCLAGSLSTRQWRSSEGNARRWTLGHRIYPTVSLSLFCPAEANRTVAEDPQKTPEST